MREFEETFEPEGLRVTAVGADAALVAYAAGRSLRASVWERTEGGWQILFHQGTPVA